MAEYINTNIASINGQRLLEKNNMNLQSSIEKLSSGLRINSASDDAAGMAIATKMTSQIMGMEQAKRNANDAISMSQVAENAMNEQVDMLQRVRELSVQSANGILSSDDREKLNNEALALTAELDRVANTTQFNGNKLLDGKNAISTDGVDFQVGAESGQVLNVRTGDATYTGLGLNAYEEVAGNASAAQIGNAGQAETFYIEVDRDGDGTADYTSSQLGIVADATRTEKEKAQAIIEAINKETPESGVVAILDQFDNAGTMQYGVTLRSASGDDVSITSDGAGTAHATPADLGLSATTSATVTKDLSLLTQNDAKTAIIQLDKALDTLSNYRSDLGAYRNRFEATVSNLSSQSQSMQAARGRIQDTDFAAETANLTKGQIMSQAATAMLSQANQIPQGVLSLLR